MNLFSVSILCTFELEGTNDCDNSCQIVVGNVHRCIAAVGFDDGAYGAGELHVGRPRRRAGSLLAL